MFFRDPGPDSQAWPSHYLPQRRGFLLGLESLMNLFSGCHTNEYGSSSFFCTHTYVGSLLAITTPEGLFIHMCWDGALQWKQIHPAALIICSPAMGNEMGGRREGGNTKTREVERRWEGGKESRSDSEQREYLRQPCIFSYRNQDQVLWPPRLSNETLLEPLDWYVQPDCNRTLGDASQGWRRSLSNHFSTQEVVQARGMFPNFTRWILFGGIEASDDDRRSVVDCVTAGGRFQY